MTNHRLPSFALKGVGYLLVLALLFGCSARRPVQQVSDVMDKMTASWFAVEATAVQLHDAGVLKGEKWNQVVGIRNKVSPLMRQLWSRWALLPDTETAVEDFMRSPDYEQAMTLIAQMTALIGG